MLIVGGVACSGKAAARLMRVDPGPTSPCWKRRIHQLRRVRPTYYVGGVVKEYRDLMTTPMRVVGDENFFRKVKHVTVHTQHLATARSSPRRSSRPWTCATERRRSSPTTSSSCRRGPVP